MSATPLERVLRRDRAVVLAAIVVIAALSWLYVVRLAADMDMPGMNMAGFRMASTGFRMIMTPAAIPWTAGEFAFMAIMWTVMMIGMMTPSVTPVVLLYARVGRQASVDGAPFAATGWFAGGYLLAWTSFAVAATAAQWGLERVAWLTPAMAGASRIFGGIVLLIAGVYQWSPLKRACLAHCQSPLSFLQRHGGFRGEAAGALRLGVRHGTYCIGCCWMLMALLFVGGIMNVMWIAALSILVLVEKTPWIGSSIGRAAGVALGAAGVALLLTAR